MQNDELSAKEDSLMLFQEHISYPFLNFESSSYLFHAEICYQCPKQREINILRSEKAWWQAMHSKLKESYEQLQQENKDLKAKLRLREKQLFGKKSEQDKNHSEQQEGDQKKKRKRGQQKGSSGHGRRKHEKLRVENEFHDLPEEEKFCPCCGLPFDPLDNTEDSDVVEVNVDAHVRRIRRRKYKRTCTCPNLPVIVTAPAPPKLIPKGAYGDSLWIEALVDKFLFYRPTSSLLKRFDLIDLNISQGTITDGLKRLTPLFEPLYEQIAAMSRTERHWHADETRWTVFVEVEGKSGYRWYLWVFKSASAVVYILDQSRSSRVPMSHLKDVNHESILSVDRYSAYKVLIREKDGAILLAWCWTHMRRDFLELANAMPEHEQWAMEWVEQIGILYHQNNERMEVLDVPEEFDRKDEILRNTAARMEGNCIGQLKDQTLHPNRRKVLESLQRHWEGLTLFIDHPEIPMDNNAAERALRGPVTGRRNFYGSGALWSGSLAAMLFSLFQTLLLWNINPKTWLEKFFRACAENGGRPLEDVSSFLPWNMDEQELDAYRGPPEKPVKDTS